jgi:hypothetical protein
MRYVWLQFAAAASCVALKSVLITLLLASAASRTGTVGTFYYTSGRYCQGLDALVTLLCLSAFSSWTYVIWTSREPTRARLLRSLVALVVSVAIFVGLGIAMVGEWSFK